MRLPVFYPTVDGWREEWIGSLNGTLISCGEGRERDVRVSYYVISIVLRNTKQPPPKRSVSTRNRGCDDG